MNPVIFRIHQSITKIRLPDSAIRKSTSCFRNKVKVSFGIYKIVGVQEEKRRGAGKRSLLINFPCTISIPSYTQFVIENDKNAPIKSRK